MLGTVKFIILCIKRIYDLPHSVCHVSYDIVCLMCNISSCVLVVLFYGLFDAWACRTTLAFHFSFACLSGSILGAIKKFEQIILKGFKY